jgi:hypothetical protein
VAYSDICSACLSRGENECLAEIYALPVNDEILSRRKFNRIKTFGNYLNLASADMPIPYVVVKVKGRSTRSGREN